MRTEELNSSNLRHLMEYYARKFTLAELRLREVLPAWIASAQSLRLKAVLNSYQKVVRNQVVKMESFFQEKNLKLDGTQVNRPVQEFLRETDERLMHVHNSKEKDAWLLASIQAVNDFKINMYEMAAGFARSLGMISDAQTFEEAVYNERLMAEVLKRLSPKEIDLSLVESVHITG